MSNEQNNILREAFTETIKEIIQKDTQTNVDNIAITKEENATFFLRVIHLFYSKMKEYYPVEVIEEWTVSNILKNGMLPDLSEIESREKGHELQRSNS